VVNAIEYLEAITGTRVVRHSKIARPMSALGQKRTFPHIWPMSVLPPKADITAAQTNVRFVPKADILRRTNNPLLDHLVGNGKQARRKGETERLRGR
jgi:hypothetical protein